MAFRRLDSMSADLSGHRAHIAPGSSLAGRCRPSGSVDPFARNLPMLLASRRALLSMGLVALCAGSIASAFAADSKRPITKLTFDPSLPQVELFDGIDSGTLTAKVVPQDQFGSKVLITNTSKTPVSVKLPDAVVGVQVF